ncbi:MAG: hypothetical protein IJG13_14665, partial [Kiritimatiellae bacterium]|nr:hypothetical protein [Kiritimatiellia bacterium]
EYHALPFVGKFTVEFDIAVKPILFRHEEVTQLVRALLPGSPLDCGYFLKMRSDNGIERRRMPLCIDAHILHHGRRG